MNEPVLFTNFDVIPAKAGIQLDLGEYNKILDSHFRGNDIVIKLLYFIFFNKIYE